MPCWKGSYAFVGLPQKNFHQVPTKSALWPGINTRQLQMAKFADSLDTHFFQEHILAHPSEFLPRKETCHAVFPASSELHARSSAAVACQSSGSVSLCAGANRKPRATGA